MFSQLMGLRKFPVNGLQAAIVDYQQSRVKTAASDIRPERWDKMG